MLSLAHVFPPRDDRSDAEMFAPTCTPSPPLMQTPPSNELDVEPADGHDVRVPAVKRSTKSKCKERSATGVKKSKNKMSAPKNDNISESAGDVNLTINGDSVVEGGVVLFEYGQEDGSVSHIGGNAEEFDNGSLTNPEGQVILYYDDIGNVYTAEKTPSDAPNLSDTDFTKVVNDITAGKESFANVTVEGNVLPETKTDDSDYLDNLDKSGCQSRGYAALCASFFVVYMYL